MSLRIIPITQEEARLFIARHHRHLDRPEGAIVCTAIEKSGELAPVDDRRREEAS